MRRKMVGRTMTNHSKPPHTHGWTTPTGKAENLGSPWKGSVMEVEEEFKSASEGVLVPSWGFRDVVVSSAIPALYRTKLKARQR